MKQEVTLGIDIGGTTTQFGLVNRSGNVLFDATVDTASFETADEYLEYLYQKIEEKTATLKSELIEVKAVGIGAPNGNYYKGIIDCAPNLKWGKSRVEFVKKFQKYFNVPMALTNDANAAALGEMIFGYGKEGYEIDGQMVPIKDFIMITLGTGLGSGIIVDGRMVYGHDGFAGEMGHIIAVENGRRCGCSRNGCLEAYASAPGLKRTVFELIAENPFRESNLKMYNYERLESKNIYEEALKGDEIALEAFARTGEILGRKLADAAAVTTPKAFFLFGGLAKSGNLILEPTRKAFYERLLNIYQKGNIIIDISKLFKEGKNIAVMGAAALAWDEYEKSQQNATI
jgi:glucokinase